VTFLQPTSWPEALAARAAHPEAVAVAGGTDVMVDINFNRLHLAAVLDLGRVRELGDRSYADGAIRLGAGVTCHDLIADLRADLPGLAMAARTVGSPQIRNRATVGGNLGSASPAGDAHPPLLASAADVEVESLRGPRRIPVREFFLGPKRSALEPDELIAAVHIPPATGPQLFAKVGVRNAMVIAVCSFAVALHPDRRRVGTGIGSAGPVPLRASEAERFLEGVLDAGNHWESRRPLADSVVSHFADLVGRAAKPIDDVRGSAAYRVHALRVLSRRMIGWAWDEYGRVAPS
jgi:CO/xanthine dehydrogenase FAD-binding subunit